MKFTSLGAFLMTRILDKTISRRSRAARPPRFLRDEKGGVAMMTALISPVLIGLVGLAVEVGSWQSDRQRLQSAVDAAAYAGSVELGLVDDEDQARNVAYAAAMLNGMAAAEIDVAFEDIEDYRAIRVTTNRLENRFFTRLYSDTDKVELVATAAAFFNPASVGSCVLILGENGAGLKLGGSSRLDTTGCSIHSNQTGPQSFDAGGSSRAVAECLSTVGGVNASLQRLTLNTCEGYEENADPIADPYAGVTIPTAAEILADGSYQNRGQGDYFSSTTPVQSGYYTDLIIQDTTSFVDGATVIIDGGGLHLKGNNTLTGTNVTIILLNGAVIQTGSQFNMQLSAKTSGPYAGMLIIGDRDPAIENHGIVGGATSQLTGAIYLPTGALKLNGGSHADIGCTHFITHSLNVVGNASLRNVCGGVGTRSIGSENPAEVKFVQS